MGRELEEKDTSKVSLTLSTAIHRETEAQRWKEINFIKHRSNMFRDAWVAQ